MRGGERERIGRGGEGIEGEEREEGKKEGEKEEGWKREEGRRSREGRGKLFICLGCLNETLQMEGLTKINVFPHVFGSWKFKILWLTDLAPSEAGRGLFLASLPCLSVVCFDTPL